jgi:peroxiredoxin
MKNRKKRSHRNQKFPIWTMIAGAVFLIGAALIMAFSANSTEVQPSNPYLIPPAVLNLPAPDLALTNLEGKAVSLRDYRGQIVLVNNWATWCPPCLAEIPELQAYYNDHAEDGFVLIGIEAGEPVSEVSAFVKSHGLTYPIWPDTEMKAITAFRNNNLPSSYLIDAEGTIRYAWSGQINRATLDKYVTPLLTP